MTNNSAPAQQAQWPLAGRLLLALALYAVYLPLSGYRPEQFRFDAAQYWELSLKFFQHGRFSLLYYDEPLRGYLGPLLLQPGRLLCHFTGWPALAGAQALGAGWAALLFGLALPAAWQLGTGQALSRGRWLLLLALGFVFWRDYFNFSLSDVPALTLLLLGLAALSRPGWAWAGMAGLLLAGALNIRPIYLAAVPGVLYLVWSLPARGPRLLALLAGASLVLLPQLRINQRHFGQTTPLVLAPTAKRPLYLQQLAWGTAFQRVETSLMPEYPRQVLFADEGGQAALAAKPAPTFNSYPDFFRFTLRHPLSFAGRSLRHLFNGLDIRQPTPYLRTLHPPGQGALRLLNYALLALGLGLAWAAWRRWVPSPTNQAQVGNAMLLVLLLPCALVLPTAMECRFLLPLHLLLLTAVAAWARPVAWWRNSRLAARLVAAVLLLAWLGACWQLSNDTARVRQPESAAKRYE